jgi:hypothetical protein
MMDILRELEACIWEKPQPSVQAASSTPRTCHRCQLLLHNMSCDTSCVCSQSVSKLLPLLPVLPGGGHSRESLVLANYLHMGLGAVACNTAEYVPLTLFQETVVV